MHDEQKIRIGQLLSLDSADNLITRMVDGLVRQQNDHIAFLSRLLQQDSSALSPLNNLGCLADKLPEQLDLKMLPHVLSDALVVSTEELEDFVLAHTRRVVTAADDASAASCAHTEIDAVAIARCIITQYTGGRPRLIMQKLRLPFLRRLKEQITSEDSSAAEVPEAKDDMGDSLTVDGLELSNRKSKRDVHIHLQLLKASNDLAKSWLSSAETVNLQGIKLPSAHDSCLQPVKANLERCCEADGTALLDAIFALVQAAKDKTPNEVNIDFFLTRL